MPKKLGHALTATAVARLRPAEPGKRRDVADGSVPGLFVRVTSSGQKTWSLVYRRKVDARLRRLTIGDFPALDLKAARKAARQTLEDVERGADPAGARAMARAERRFARESGLAVRGTVSWAAALFDAEHIATKKPRTQKEQRRAINKVMVPAWSERPLLGVAKADVAGLIKSVRATSGHVAANRTLTIIRTFFKWAVDSELINAEPSHGIKASDEVPREVVLSDPELVALWRAFDQLGDPFGPYFKTLALLGQRRTETALLQREHVRDGGATWVIPRAARKAGGEHLVPLSSHAREVLATLPERKDGPFLFSSTNGERPVSGYSKPKARADAIARAALGGELGVKLEDLSSLKDWRLHDLRRTMATWMASVGVAPHVVAAVLGHADSTVTRRHYNLYSYQREKLAALEAWGEQLRSLTSGDATLGNVVALRTVSSRS